MLLADVVKRVLDITSHTNDPVYETRALDAVKESLTRLTEKTSFEDLRTIQTYSLDSTGSFRIANNLKDISSAQCIETKTYWPIVDERAYRMDNERYGIITYPSDTLIRRGALFMTLPKATNLTFGLTGYSIFRGTTEDIASTTYQDFISSALPYLIHDAILSLILVDGATVERISTHKQLRDEAFNDLITINESRKEFPRY